MNVGRITSSDGIDVAPGAWTDAFAEQQVPWSNALQARARDGVPYLLGPTARVSLAGDPLHPLAREALAATGLGDELRTNVFRSIVARAVELVHAVAEARDLIDRYVAPAEPHAAWQPRPGVAAWATEAPRGFSTTAARSSNVRLPTFSVSVRASSADIDHASSSTPRRICDQCSGAIGFSCRHAQHGTEVEYALSGSGSLQRSQVVRSSMEMGIGSHRIRVAGGALVRTERTGL
jgi:coenzyme F420-reducing hydrogenase alpha subunit